MKRTDITPMTVIYAVGTSEKRLHPGIVLALDHTYRSVITGTTITGYRKIQHTVQSRLPVLIVPGTTITGYPKIQHTTQYRLPVLIVPVDVDPAEAARIAEATVTALDNGNVPLLPTGYALTIRNGFPDVRRTWAEQTALFEQARERSAQVTARVEQARQAEDEARTRVQDIGSEGITCAGFGRPIMPRTWVEIERLCEAYAAEWAARRAGS